MSYQEKRTLATMTSGILVLAAYGIYAFGGGGAETFAANDLRARAISMLVFIGVGVVATIIIQIVFHIFFSAAVAIRERNCEENEVEKQIKIEMIEDERDKLIELKSSKVGFICAGVGFFLGLIALVLNFPAIVMLDIVFISFNIASLIEGLTTIIYYRKGAAYA